MLIRSYNIIYKAQVFECFVNKSMSLQIEYLQNILVWFLGGKKVNREKKQ